jgi:hypothetical protein
VTVSKRQRNTHIWEADPHGHYPEPLWTSKRLFQVESFGTKGALILDPCAGWGRIPHAAMAAGYTAIGCDIVDRRHEPLSHNGFKFVLGDFFENPLPMPIRSAGSAVFNPPFTGDYIQQFVERALAIVEFKVAALVPVRRLPAAHWLRGKPLETIWLLTPRPSLPPASYIRAGNEPGGGGQDFCWLVLRRGFDGSPAVKWLQRDDAS